MKSIRTTALVAASIVSLSATALSAGVAHADSPALVPLEFKSICRDAATNVGVWTVTNKNSDSVSIDWTNLDNGEDGSVSALAANGTQSTDTTFTTYMDADDHNNTTEFTWTAVDMSQPSGTQTDHFTTNISETACTADQLPATPTTGGDNGSQTPATPAPTTPQEGGNVGGKGGGNPGAASTETPAATPAATTAAAPQLAYTGASRLLPYTAAAIIALFTAATTVLVRKNVI